MTIRSLRVCLFAAAAFAVPVGAQVPSPLQFLGHEVGADHRLCNYTDMIDYFRAVESKTDRMRLVDIGGTSYGQRMLMAVISSPENLARIDRLREICQGLSKGRGIDDAEARELADEGRAFVWIDAGLHSTETIAGQNIIELVWQMASRDDAEVRRILDEVVLLACPVNPDGYELVANAYRATRSTSIPVLYQRYIGHDNNRDFYACNQIEAQNVNRVFFKTWCPQIVYNHHQSAPRGTIIYTPPFRDPQNYYTDPMVTRGIEIVSAHMNARFAHEGKPGVISRSGASYSGWWNGGLRTTNYFHNVIGILTESFGRPEPTKITQRLSRRLPYGDYPDPVKSQIWHARQTVEYLQTANFAILDYASRYRRELLHGIWTMATRSIERGSRDHWTPTPRLVALAEEREESDAAFTDPDLRDPRVYILPADQGDRSAAARFVRALHRCGIDVHRATAPFTVDGNEYPAGSFVVKTAQAYRPHVLDQFEPQWYPNDMRDGKPVPPYDSSGWTLAMQMDVGVVRCYEDVDGPFKLVADGEFLGKYVVPGAKVGWTLDPSDTHTPIAINKLLAEDCRVEWSSSRYFVPRSIVARDALREVALSVGAMPIPQDRDVFDAATAVERARVGLFDTYGGHMPTGWDQWILQEFGFPVQQVFGDRVEAGDLAADFDVLVFHTGLPGPRDLQRAARRRNPPDLEKLEEVLPPFEDWSNLKARNTALTAANTLPALRAFVEGGGTLLALGRECQKVIRHFDLPVKVGTHVVGDDGEERRTTREEFYIPGSLISIEVDTEHRLGRGCSVQMAAVVRGSSPILEVAAPSDDVEVVASYQPKLLSGWAVGEEHLAGKAAVVSARVGKGRIVLYGADVTYRGQPLGTMKMVFNAILSAKSAK